MVVLGLDIYFGRAYDFDPWFAIVREPGSVEVVFAGWMLIISRAVRASTDVTDRLAVTLAVPERGAPPPPPPPPPTTA